MFLGLAWYWWLVIVAVLIISIPFKEQTLFGRGNNERWLYEFSNG